jgi:hypothetical protein
MVTIHLIHVGNVAHYLYAIPAISITVTSVIIYHQNLIKSINFELVSARIMTNCLIASNSRRTLCSCAPIYLVDHVKPFCNLVGPVGLEPTPKRL